MSVEFPTTSASIAIDDVDVPAAPEDVFPEIVANPSLCCQRCFHRLRSRRRFPPLAGYDYGGLLAFVDAVLPEGAEWEVLDTEYYTTDPISDRLKRMHPPDEADSRQGCGLCGAVEPHRSPSTRSRSEALEAAIGVTTTLSELGIAHNPLALLVEVGDLKRDPDYAGDDHETFRIATARAVRAGRA
ncbi:hypothetical protein VB779_08600 [Haloarculaceae archaeon H-GB11]|nr:hypothetical protein [Haloarculaceae archaeon H-GB11]